jgi:DNA-binding response OmpR family regulator
MLDVGLPGEDGFALARWLRERSGRVGIIMVTAAGDTVDRAVERKGGAIRNFDRIKALRQYRAARAAEYQRDGGPRVRIPSSTTEEPDTYIVCADLSLVSLRRLLCPRWR